MQNPYEILGIREGASQEEIKAAYREQVKKYHPDKYQANPLYELAEEKLQEVNEAYEYLMKNSGGGSYSGGNSGGSGFSANYQDVRRTIDRGDLMQAENMLNNINTRNAEWFFLKGMLSLKKGWYDDAITNIQTATSMEPNNMEYRSAMNSIMSSSNGYRTSAYGRGYGRNNNDMFCQALQCYCCADMCCDCI